MPPSEDSFHPEARVTTPNTQPWQEAFRVEVRHTYFSDGGRCAPVRWQPVAQTAAQLAALGLVCRIDNGTLSVWQPQGAASHAPTDLLFELTATDPWFAHYTAPDVTHPNTTLWFDTTSAPAADDSGTAARRLHQAATVSAADQVARDALPLPLQRWITQHAPQATVGFLNIRYAPSDPPGTAWHIAFDARAMVWQYVVPGAAGRTLFIRDADGQVDFEPPAPAPSPYDAGTIVMRSTVAVALKERSPHRFQLMEVTPQGERVLIKTLPGASASALQRETVSWRDIVVAVILVDL